MTIDTDFVLKWSATVTLIVGTLVNSLGYYPEGVLLLVMGGFLWLIVAMRWRDNALIATNLIMSLTGILGLAYNYLIK